MKAHTLSVVYSVHTKAMRVSHPPKHDNREAILLKSAAGETGTLDEQLGSIKHGSCRSGLDSEPRGSRMRLGSTFSPPGGQTRNALWKQGPGSLPEPPPLLRERPEGPRAPPSGPSRSPPAPTYRRAGAAGSPAPAAAADWLEPLRAAAAARLLPWQPGARNRGLPPRPACSLPCAVTQAAP